jgi:hypothetical protein
VGFLMSLNADSDYYSDEVIAKSWWRSRFSEKYPEEEIVRARISALRFRARQLLQSNPHFKKYVIDTAKNLGLKPEDLCQ